MIYTFSYLVRQRYFLNDSLFTFDATNEGKANLPYFFLLFIVVQVIGGTKMNAHQVGKKLAPSGYPIPPFI